MAKYAWFFSIILVLVFVFEKLVFTHVLRTKLSSLELRSFYHELWLNWMVLKQAVLMGTWITMLKCCFNWRLTNPTNHPGSNQAVGCSVVSRNQLKSSSDLFFVPWIPEKTGEIWPLSPAIFPGGVVGGGYPEIFHEKRHWWRADLFEVGWSWWEWRWTFWVFKTTQNTLEH